MGEMEQVEKNKEVKFDRKIDEIFTLMDDQALKEATNTIKKYQDKKLKRMTDLRHKGFNHPRWESKGNIFEGTQVVVWDNGDIRVSERIYNDMSLINNKLI